MQCHHQAPPSSGILNPKAEKTSVKNCQTAPHAQQKKKVSKMDATWRAKKMPLKENRFLP